MLTAYTLLRFYEKKNGQIKLPQTLPSEQTPNETTKSIFTTALFIFCAKQTIHNYLRGRERMITKDGSHWVK